MSIASPIGSFTPVFPAFGRRKGSERRSIDFELHDQSRNLVATYAGEVVGELASMGSTFGMVMNTLLGGSAVTALAYGSIPLITHEEAPNERLHFVKDDDAIKWTVAGVVSCIPFLNWVAWVFIGLDCDVSFPFFMLAFLYSTPFLMSGFDLNQFATFMFLAGILHVQVERLAQTEPNALIASLEGNKELLKALRASGSYLSTSLSELMGGVGSNVEALNKKADRHAKDSSLMEMIDAEMKSGEQELKRSKELADVEKGLWDETLGDRKKPKSTPESD
ncbi:hypothetical protein BSKO_12923 [Bryopsis sp. KO-2023]|nr:hypothetical protein BSKO_12923 [Bryopsis sp. KO-2023]